jgi:uncharacterized protein
MSNIRPFHLAFPVNNIEETKKFYTEILECKVGRSSEKCGHQISAHLKPEKCNKALTNGVDGKNIPVKHFGVILTMTDWENLSEKLILSGIEFIVEPYIRFQGEVGEQATMFFLDPSGNALEFKAFKDDSFIFKS